MKRNELVEALAKARANAKKRKFKQSVDVTINLKGLNQKKPEDQIDMFHSLPHFPGRERKVCALVGAELKEQGDKFCQLTILNDDFPKYEGKKKEIKKLASEYDYFVAQAPFMAAIAKTFGRYFGPKNKMPNPKAGCVVPPNANLENVTKKLNSTVRLFAKTKPLIQLHVGMEDMDDEKIIENVMSIYKALVHKLPGEESNIRSVYVKLTMGKSIKVGAKEEKKEAQKEVKEEKAKPKGEKPAKKEKKAKPAEKSTEPAEEKEPAKEPKAEVEA